MTVIWSSPPMTARTARMAGSANAALMSAARCSAVAPTRRVVGYSTGIRPVTSASRRMACSCTAGKAPGAANDGDTTATCSPLRALGGWTRSCPMRVIEAHHRPRPHPTQPAPSCVVTGVGEDVATNGKTAGSSQRHGRPVVLDHQRDGESPGSASEPCRLANAELPPEDLPGGRIKDFPGHRQVDCGIPDRQAAEVQYRRQTPVLRQQVLRSQVAVVPAWRRPVLRPRQPHCCLPQALGGVKVEREVTQCPATLDVLPCYRVHGRERLASVPAQVRVAECLIRYFGQPQGVHYIGKV